MAFPWKRRDLAQALGVGLARAVAGESVDLSDVSSGPGPSTPRPRIPVVAVTGTNGKTTTTTLTGEIFKA